MRKADVVLNRTYWAKVSGRVVPVRLDTHASTGWNATNLKTGKTIRIKTAGRLRGEVVNTPKSLKPFAETEPNAEQMDAVIQYAESRGANWKDDLHTDWMRSGSTWSGPYHLLQQVRNQHGPKWLAAFDLGVFKKSIGCEETANLDSKPLEPGTLRNARTIYIDGVEGEIDTLDGKSVVVRCDKKTGKVHYMSDWLYCDKFTTRGIFRSVNLGPDTYSHTDFYLVSLEK